MYNIDDPSEHDYVVDLVRIIMSKKYAINRRILIKDIKYLSYSLSSNEFILHVPKDSLNPNRKDYSLLQDEHRNEIIRIIVDINLQNNTNKPYKIYFHTQKRLSNFVTFDKGKETCEQLLKYEDMKEVIIFELFNIYLDK